MIRRLVTAVLGDAAASSQPVLALQFVALLACAAITVFIATTLATGRFPSPVQYGVVLLLASVAIFLLRPGPLARGGRVTAPDLALSLVLVGMSVYSVGYLMLNYRDIAALREGLPNTADLWAYGLGTLAVLFAAHRAEGWLMLSVVLAAIGYLMFGQFLPGILHHRPFDLSQVLEIAYSYQGIFGVAFGSVVDVVYIFVVLGAAMRITGAGEFFNDLALMVTRGRRSGPAQAAVVASTLFGSINGSAPANVASTGVLTIPMMKRAGFTGRFAGGVESTASCVGQIMPPVMGVGAFIMADITGIPYAQIMVAAIVPALLYIFSISVAVALEAGRLGMEPVPGERLEWDTRRKSRGLVLVLGFGVLLAMLLAGYPATYCGLVAVGTVLLTALILPATRPGLRELWVFIVDGGRDGLTVALSCAAIGIVIAAVSTTGLGVKINQLIVMLGNQHLLAALVLAAVCSIVLGMGLPTAAAYLMVVFVAGPAVMELGVSQLQTHLFVFYYAVLSAITPPVALAVFAAAAIAKEPPVPLALAAMRLALVGFILPIAWIYHPEIMIGAGGSYLLDALLYLPQLMLAVVAISTAHVGYFTRPLPSWQRAALALSAAMIFYPGAATTLTGVAIIIVLLGLSLRNWRSSAKAA